MLVVIVVRAGYVEMWLRSSSLSTSRTGVGGVRVLSLWLKCRSGRVWRVVGVMLTDGRSREVNYTSWPFDNPLVTLDTSGGTLVELLSDIPLPQRVLSRSLVCLWMPDTPTILIVGIVGLGKEGTDG